ncbi:hypothetical protein P280DRAFT_548517 [Massarina eburnea CBS 473.64]|uniref:Uncharacterized protein n=1 Tax=Massarina eburnea CBS 473.64 TaxID=1395130 RepID=A0A6A6S215_9PLEO|nr:hypothetical protein P280DRAFT_548517 [Massarina eburnea CBS 473.64]
MSGLKDIVKGGWHPEKKTDGNSSSSGGDGGRLGKVKGLMSKDLLGKGGGEAREDPHSHQSAPLSTLKDPASFGPPPKHIHYHGTAAVQGTARPTPPLPQRRVQEEDGRAPPLPKPPVLRPGQAPSPAAAKPKPSLPPRLPPRQNSNPHEYTPGPPPPYSETPFSPGQLNQGALNRIGQAGVSVPGFNIGRTASPPVPPRRTASPALASPTTETNRNPQLGELQSRFGKMSTSSSEAPSTGTTWAQKQAALKTAGNLRDNPSKVSMSDMRSAASTANNFRERHGEQAAAGWKSANGLNQKYGIANKVNTLAASSSRTPPPQSPTAGGFGKKPPPPPPKKKELVGSPGEPPPLPLGSKPKF